MKMKICEKCGKTFVAKSAIEASVKWSKHFKKCVKSADMAKR